MGKSRTLFFAHIFLRSPPPRPWDSKYAYDRPLDTVSQDTMSVLFHLNFFSLLKMGSFLTCIQFHLPFILSSPTGYWAHYKFFISDISLFNSRISVWFLFLSSFSHLLITMNKSLYILIASFLKTRQLIPTSGSFQSLFLLFFSFDSWSHCPGVFLCLANFKCFSTGRCVQSTAETLNSVFSPMMSIGY